jgi:GT2 family glycosyltransferase
MFRAVERRYEIGMCAPQIRLAGTDTIDSAGMLICRDGSSKQRGHGRPCSEFQRPGQTLFPSGCAALYRRAMLDEVGLFEESFFLYCEDADLGLRARWKMWECVYAPDAIVDHKYSQSSGRASETKAWYVERNRLRVAIRNLPLQTLVVAPFYSAARYFWHAAYMKRGAGRSGEFRQAGGSAPALASIVMKANFDALRRAPSLWRQRREIRKTARMSPKQFARLIDTYSISPREVAAQ